MDVLLINSNDCLRRYSLLVITVIMAYRGHIIIIILL